MVFTRKDGIFIGYVSFREGRFLCKWYASNLQTNLCFKQSHLSDVCEVYQLNNLNADDAVIKKWKQPRNLNPINPSFRSSIFAPHKDFNLPVADFVSYKMNMAEKCQHLCGKARHRRSNSGGATRSQLQRPKNSFWGLLWASVFGGWEFFPFYFGFADGMVQNIGNSTKWPNVNISIHTYVHILIYHTYIHIYIYIINYIVYKS